MFLTSTVVIGVIENYCDSCSAFIRRGGQVSWHKNRFCILFSKLISLDLRFSKILEVETIVREFDFVRNCE